jgi:hypothetical protein
MRELRAMSLIAALAVSVSAPPAGAQGFTADQQSVVDFVVRCRQSLAEDNVDAGLGCYHADYSGWEPGQPLPAGKAELQALLPAILAREQTSASSVRPLDVRVLGQSGFIHYLHTRINQSSDGTAQSMTTAWTEVVVRENGRWYWIASHGHRVGPGN